MTGTNLPRRCWARLATTAEVVVEAGAAIRCAVPEAVICVLFALADACAFFSGAAVAIARTNRTAASGAFAATFCAPVAFEAVGAVVSSPEAFVSEFVACADSGAVVSHAAVAMA